MRQPTLHSRATEASPRADLTVHLRIGPLGQRRPRRDPLASLRQVRVRHTRCECLFSFSQSPSAARTRITFSVEPSTSGTGACAVDADIQATMQQRSGEVHPIHHRCHQIQAGQIRGQQLGWRSRWLPRTTSTSTSAGTNSGSVMLNGFMRCSRIGWRTGCRRNVESINAKAARSLPSCVVRSPEGVIFRGNV